VENKHKEFEEVALQYMTPLYAAALRMARSESEAQDLVQDSYLRAYRFFDTFEKGTNFKAWLFTILKNTYINKYCKESKMPPMEPICGAEAEALKASATPENEIFGKLFDDDITRAMNSLPDDFRLAVILSDLEELSYKEIAEVLDCPIGTVMSRLHRGRSLLRESLYDYAKKRGYVRN
jgi:RNA polymerase sigma-70 factor (ECF subfamily)